MKYEMDNRTGQMVPKRDENIYFGGSMGGGLIVDDKKNNVKFIIERDGRITWLFSTRKNTHIYDTREGHIIADRVKRKFGPEHKYCDYRYFVRNMRAVDEGNVMNFKDFVNEGIFSQMVDNKIGKKGRDSEERELIIDGEKYIVSLNIKNEKDFIEFVDSVLDDMVAHGEAYFTRKNHKDDCITIETAYNDIFFVLPNFEDTVEYNEYGFDPVKRFNDIDYNAFCKYMSDLLIDACIMQLRDEDYLILATEEDIYNKYQMVMYENNIEDYQFSECFNDLIEDFVYYCNNSIKLDYQFTNDDIHFHSFNNYADNILVKFDLCMIRHYDEMKKWWDDTLNKIEEVGPVEFFGLDEEEEE